MMTRTLAALAVALMSIPVPLLTAEEGSGGGRYVAGTGHVVFWCAPADHPLVPQGLPWEYPSPFWWLISGEIYCAGADVRNHLHDLAGEEREEHGFGGFAFPIGYDATVLEVEALDDGYGVLPMQTLQGEYCGTGFTESVPPQSIPAYFVWIRVLTVDSDLHPCFGTTGTIQGTWT